MTLKKFIIDEDHPPLFYREGTSDEVIIDAILIKQTEYKFPKMSPKKIWDVGANIGVTSRVLNMIYPDATIYAFEPQADNFRILEMNTAEIHNIKIFNFGLGTHDEKILGFPSEDSLNHGGFSVKIKSDKPTENIDIHKTTKILERIGAPDLIKIDTEGSEYAILNSFSDEQLEQCKWIAGELHNVNDFLLLNRLDQYFDLEVSRHFDSKNYHFHARSKYWTDQSKNI